MIYQSLVQKKRGDNERRRVLTLPPCPSKASNPFRLSEGNTPTKQHGLHAKRGFRLLRTFGHACGLDAAAVKRGSATSTPLCLTTTLYPPPAMIFILPPFSSDFSPCPVLSEMSMSTHFLLLGTVLTPPTEYLIGNRKWLS